MSAIRISNHKGALQNNEDPIDHIRQGENKVSKHFKEYAEGTSLHGIKYIGEDGRHAVER